MSSNDEPAREADARSKTGRSVLAWTLGVLLGAVLLTATWIEPSDLFPARSPQVTFRV